MAKMVGWPEGWQLSAEMREYATSRGIANPDDEFEGFRDYHEMKGNKFASWAAAWRTWCRNSERFNKVPTPKFEGKVIGFTRPQAVAPEQVRQAIADNEAAALETASLTVAQRQANIRRLSEIYRSIRK